MTVEIHIGALGIKILAWNFKLVQIRISDWTITQYFGEILCGEKTLDVFNTVFHFLYKEIACPNIIWLMIDKTETCFAQRYFLHMIFQCWIKYSCDSKAISHVTILLESTFLNSKEFIKLTFRKLSLAVQNPYHRLLISTNTPRTCDLLI